MCGSGMGAPIIALLLRRFCGEVGAPTAHVGARRGAVRGDNEAFQPSSSEALGQIARQPPLSVCILGYAMNLSKLCKLS